MKPGTLISKFNDHQSFFFVFLQLPLEALTLDSLTPLKLS